MRSRMASRSTYPRSVNYKWTSKHKRERFGNRSLARERRGEPLEMKKKKEEKEDDEEKEVVQ